MNIEMTKELFGDLWDYVIDSHVTDIKWNGRQLWIDDLTKGRYLSPVILSNDFLNIFTSKIALSANVNFNSSHPTLQAETRELRIHAIHPFRTGDNTYILALRKTPAVARLNQDNIIESHYANRLIILLLQELVMNQCSGIIIGDVGSGKTELVKYIASFIPHYYSTMSVEDTLEMKLPELYPDKDISAVKTDDDYTTELAIRDALRLLVKYLFIAEARGREIARIIEGASTGCVVWTTIHCQNVWEIPDRVVQMSGKEGQGQSFENDVYSFFDVGIKVKKTITNDRIVRSIDQICFFTRVNKKNQTVVFYNNGRYTHQKLPVSIMKKFQNKELVYLLRKIERKNHGKY